MPKYIRKWLVRIILNFIGLLLALGLMYVASLVVVLQISTRATAKNPLFNIIDRESLVVVVGIVAIWLIFRSIGKLYTLLANPPKPD